MTQKMIEQQIRLYVDGNNSVMWQEMYNADSPKKNVRRVEVCRSPWWKKSNPNYAVLFKNDGQLLGCENGLSRAAAIKSVKAWEARHGWMN